MDNKMVGFSSVSNEEMMNVDGGFWPVFVAAVFVLSFVRIQSAY